MKILTFPHLVLCCLLLCLNFTLPEKANAANVLTMLDGGGILIRGLSSYKLSEGVTFEKDDIVETGNQSSALLEFEDGTIAAIGPQTKILLLSISSKSVAGFEVFLLSGQLKIAVDNESRHRISSSSISSIDFKKGVIVFNETHGVPYVFVEKGNNVSLVQTAKKTPYLLTDNSFFVAKPGQKVELATRPSTEFVSGLPRIFLDNLPSRKERFKNSKLDLKNPQNFNYNEVEAWLKTVPEIRKIFVRKWKHKAKEPEFRKALIDNLHYHPEWDPILYPQKYSKSPHDKRIESDTFWKQLNY